MFPNSSGLDPMRLSLCKYLSRARESISWKLNMKESYSQNVVYYNIREGTIQALTMQATDSLSV